MRKQTPTQEDHGDLLYSTSKWHRALYEMERTTNNGLREVEVKGKGKNNQFPQFMRELFTRMYNPNTPRIDEPEKGTEWAEKLHDLAENMGEFQALCSRTAGDELWAGMATSALSKEIISKMRPKETNEDLDGMRKRIESLEDLKKQGLDVEDRLNKALEKLEQAEKRAADMADGLDPSSIRTAIREGCTVANESIDEAQAALSAFAYGDSPGIPSSKKGKDRAAITSLVSSSRKLKEIAELAGKLRRIAAHKQRSKADRAREEINDIEQGGDLARVLPSEFLPVAAEDEALELLFMAKLVERASLQYKIGGKEEQGRGPVILCVDESGSMSGEAENWSKAVSLALLDVARRQKRSWAFVHFDSKVQRVDYAPKGQIDPNTLVECMNHFSGGGTSFEAPIEKAFELIDKDGGFKRADVILITDGYSQTSDRFNQLVANYKDEMEVSIFTVLVNGVQAAASVAEWSDQIWTLREILESATTGPGSFEDTTFSI